MIYKNFLIMLFSFLLVGCGASEDTLSSVGGAQRSDEEIKPLVSPSAFVTPIRPNSELYIQEIGVKITSSAFDAIEELRPEINETVSLTQITENPVILDSTAVPILFDELEFRLKISSEFPSGWYIPDRSKVMPFTGYFELPRMHEKRHVEGSAFPIIEQGSTLTSTLQELYVEGIVTENFDIFKSEISQKYRLIEIPDATFFPDYETFILADGYELFWKPIGMRENTIRENWITYDWYYLAPREAEFYYWGIRGDLSEQKKFVYLFRVDFGQ